MADQYIFDAFISYRHVEPDSYVAKRIHKLLENYKLPGNAKRKLKKEYGKACKTKITRVFRDEEELPLSASLNDTILEAIKGSEWLIVICSPRLKESVWCQKEIDSFIAMHGQEHVLAVLVEGEPSESFPEQILHRKQTYVDARGQYFTVEEAVEPLAADVRGKNHSEMNRKMKNEILRLLAPMFALSFDDLKQRHREKAIKRTIGISAAVVTASLLFGGYCIYNNMQIAKKNRELVRKQENICYDLALFFAMDSEDNFNKDLRKQAVQNAYTALTNYEEFEMPYTDEARLALANSLDIYKSYLSYVPKHELFTYGRIEHIYSSPLLEQVVVDDEIGQFVFWNAFENTVIKEMYYDYNEEVDEEHKACLNDYGIFVCVNGQNTEFYNVITGARLYQTDEFLTKQLYCFDDYVLIMESQNMYLLQNMDSFNPDDWEVLLDGNYLYGTIDKVFDASKNIVIFSTKEEKGPTKVNFLNMNTNNQQYLTIESGTVIDAKYHNEKIYTLIEDIDDTKDEVKNLGIHISCYEWDGAAWSRVWLSEFHDWNGREIDFQVDPETGKEYIYALTDYSYILLDSNTGEELRYIPFGKKMVGFESLSDGICCYLENGSQFTILVQEDGWYKEYDSLFEYRGDTICDMVTFQNLRNRDNGLLVIPYSSNKTVFYGETGPRQMETVKDCPADIEVEYYLFYEAQDKAYEMGLSGSAMIYGLLFEPSGRYVFVTYYDDYVEVFESDTLESVAIWKAEHESACVYYYGEDTEGNFIIGNERDGYIVSPNGGLIGKVPYLCGYDSRNNLLILTGSTDEGYDAIPCYTLNDLLRIAEEYLNLEKSQ
ncbi:MAG: toll/interleukin-1 receptor domain-containing protein [Lachnospiraceae bacterium]